VYENGEVDAYGSAENVEPATLAEDTYIVAAQTAANGFWATTNKGNILTYAGAQYAGALDAVYSDAGVAELIGDPQKRGYRIASNDGPVYPFNLSQVGGVNNIKQPAAAASTQSGDGFWLISSSGYITSFGDASNLNSIEVGDRRVVDAATYADGMIVLINDGSVNILGSGENYGDLKQESLKSPLVDIDPTPDETGYRITAKDGTVYVFGSAKKL
jgi:hypothetical protein